MVSKNRSEAPEFAPVRQRADGNTRLQRIGFGSQELVGAGISRFHKEDKTRDNPAGKRKHEGDADEPVKLSYSWEHAGYSGSLILALKLSHDFNSKGFYDHRDAKCE